VDLFLRNDLKVLKLFLLKWVLFTIDIEIKETDKSTHPGREINLVKIKKRAFKTPSFIYKTLNTIFSEDP
jgi:hypothetical protein